jgi:hypothetical protein
VGKKKPSRKPAAKKPAPRKPPTAKKRGARVMDFGRNKEDETKDKDVNKDAKHTKDAKAAEGVTFTIAVVTPSGEHHYFDGPVTVDGVESGTIHLGVKSGSGPFEVGGTYRITTAPAKETKEAKEAKEKEAK